MSQNKTKHLVILTETEVQALYVRPYFVRDQKTEYFALPSEATEIVSTLADNTAVYFILQWGYFRASHRFYDFKVNDMCEDIKFIVKYKARININEFNLPSRNTCNRVKHLILNLFQYNEVTQAEKKILYKHALRLASQHSKPHIIFRELTNYIERQQWVLPVYSVMQDLIGRAISEERSRLTKKIKRLLSSKIKLKLDLLLTTEDDLYAISELKKDIKNFSCKEIKKEIKKRDKNKDIYAVARKILPKLNISKANIAYYASLAEYYTVYKLKRIPGDLVYLYLLCYVYHRTQKLNDNLVLSFIYKVSKCYEEAIDYGKQQFLLSQKTISYEKEKIGLILNYFCDNGLQRYRFRTIANRAYKIMPKELLIKVRDLFLNETKKETSFRWEYFEIARRTITLNIKPLFLAIDFDSDESHHPILKAAEALKAIYVKKQFLSKCDASTFSKQAIPKKLKPYLQDGNSINAYKYAFLVYYRLMKYLVNNKIYFNDTISFKSFEEDIKITKDWEHTEDKQLKNLALPKLSMAMKSRLEELEETLEQSYVGVNARIESGENNDVNVKPDGKT